MRSTSLAPVSPATWDGRLAAHLLNRAGFGAPKALAARLADMPPAAAVDHLVYYEDTHFSFPKPEFVVPYGVTREVYVKAKKLEPEEAQKKRNEVRKAELAALGMLTAWWYERMYTSPRPLEEKLTLFWQGHFATSAQKVRTSEGIYRHNEMLRANASGNLKTLTTEVGKSPIMLRYLDNDRSTKAHPNENWARELMELFTMGVGTYSEDDIKASARAFTGWTHARGEFAYRERVHDDGEKTFLGRTGAFEGSDIIDIIFEQEVTARFFATKLWTYFAYEDPEPEIIEALAATLRKHNYDLKPALRQMFLSEAFYNERAVGTQIKSPTQLLVKLAHDLHLDPVPFGLMARSGTALGQNLFNPPNVKGWDGGYAWANANAMMQRYNLPSQLAAAPVEPRPSEMARQPFTMEGMMDGSMQMLMQPEKKRFADMRNDVNEMLKAMPKAESNAWRKKMRQEKDPKKRRQMVLNLMDEVNPDARWRADRVYDLLAFDTAGEAIDALRDHYLSVPLGAEQRGVLLQALGANSEADSVTPETLDVKDKNATLHLLLSSAEYQLC